MARQKWLMMQTRPGATPPTAPESIGGGGRIMPQPTGLAATGIIRGIAVTFNEPGVNKNRWAHSEVHVSTTSGFTPSSATLKDVGRKTHFEVTEGLRSGTTYYVKVYHVDVNGAKSIVSAEVSAVAGGVTMEDIEQVLYEGTVSFTFGENDANYVKFAEVQHDLLDISASMPFIKHSQISEFTYPDTSRSYYPGGSIGIEVISIKESGFTIAAKTSSNWSVPGGTTFDVQWRRAGIKSGN